MNLGLPNVNFTQRQGYKFKFLPKLSLDRGSLIVWGPFIALQGPVVQSIISLTSSLRGQLVKWFTAL